MPWKAPAAADTCPKCHKSVFANEAKLGAGHKWHSMCFKCTQCNKLLESTTVAEHDGTLYCKSCHGKQFGTKGYGYGQGAGVLSMDTGSSSTVVTSSSTAGATPSSRPALTQPVGGGAACSAAGSDGCARCGGRVYEAEKKIAIGRDWHKACFNCATCHKSLDSTTLNDKDGDIYCKGCYGKQFGPKGVGYGIGAGALQT